MKNLHTSTNQNQSFLPHTGKTSAHHSDAEVCVDVSGIEPEVLNLRLWIGNLTPFYWKTYSPEYTPLLVIYLVDAGLKYLKRVPDFIPPQTNSIRFGSKTFHIMFQNVHSLQVRNLKHYDCSPPTMCKKWPNDFLCCWKYWKN